MQHWFLRWRFEYSDGKPPKYGQWDRHGDIETDQAWRQDKTNLLYACIEGKDNRTKDIQIFHRCLGADFVNFNWIATASVGGLKVGGAVTPTPRIVGLMLIDRIEKHQVYSGGIIESFAHGIDYSIEQLAGFGR